MKIEVLSLFPEFFSSFLSQSIVARAISKQALEVQTFDIRAYANNKHHQVDDYPYGGFAGMVGMIQPLWDALLPRVLEGNAPVIYFSPQGRPLKQKMLCDYAQESRVILICGHYKEIDQRFRRLAVSDEISIGDYVLSGGELAAQVFIDGVARLLPGVLSDINSAQTDSFYSSSLGFPCYTRPSEFLGQQVPDSLLNGNHAKIAEWAQAEARLLTRVRRPDLLSDKDR
ncbi:MAG: tRNA (guanosine(37)-N1)-methyltransferase TrmD [Candidatus Cloacimonadaceae bacterium]|jgi:tRNA (guanine37-N1)-methyltransferase|nr:tRNA (guanosine(37)-N1)-methyltransferase TrmD [Candidatus Cloacimonadaceae bacterium]